MNAANIIKIVIEEVAETINIMTTQKAAPNNDTHML